MKGRSLFRPAMAVAGGVLLCAAALSTAAAAPRRVVIPAAEMKPVITEISWLSPALVQSLKAVLQQFGAQVSDAPVSAPPAAYADLTAKGVKEWLGKDQAAKTELVFLILIQPDADKITLNIWAHDLGAAADRAEKTASVARSRLPRLLPALVEQVNGLMALNPSAEAMAEVLAGYDSSLAAFSFYGQSFAAGSLEDKARLLGLAVAGDPNFSAAWMQYGLVLYSMGKKTDARDAFNRVARRNPRAKEAFNNLGVIAGEVNDVGAARKAFREAIKIDGAYLEARFNLAKLLDREKNLDEALKEYDAILELDPSMKEAVFYKALLLDRMGRPEKAMEMFHRLSGLDPSMAEGFFNQKGRESRQEKKYQEAEAFFKRALDINPQAVEVYRELGSNSYMAGEYAKSLSYFRMAAEKMPQSAEISHYQGLAAAKAGQEELARSSFQRAIELEDFTASHYELGKLYFDARRYAEAVASLNRYLAKAADNEEAKSLLAQAAKKAMEETELARQKADFAGHRLEKIEQIVSDLNRRNSELETTLVLVRTQANGFEAEAKRLRDEKTSLEQELSRRLQESVEGLKGINKQLSEVKGIQNELLAEKKARQAAEEALAAYIKQIKEEGKLVIPAEGSGQDIRRLQDQADGLRRRIMEMEEALTKSRAELEAARSASAGSEAKSGRPSGAIQSMEDELAALRNDFRNKLAEAQADVIKSRAAVEDMKTAMARLESERGALRDRADLLQLEKDDYQKRLQSQKGGATDVDALRNRYESLEKELNGRRDEIAGLKAQLAQKEKEAAEAGRQAAWAADREKAAEAARAQLGEMSAKYKLLEAEKADLVRRLQAAEVEKKDLVRKAALTTGDMESTAKEKDRFIKELEEREKGWQKKFDELLQARRNVTEEIEGIREASQAKARELESLLSEERRLRQENDKKVLSLTRDRDECLTVREAVSSDKNRLAAEISSCKEEAKKAKEAAETARSGAAASQAEAGRLKSEIQTQAKELETARTKNIAAAAEADILIKKHGAETEAIMKKYAAEAESQKKKSVEEVEALKKRLSEESLKLEALQVEKASLEKALTAARQDAAKSGNEVTRLTAEATALAEAKKAAQNNAASLEKEVSTSKIERDSLRSQLREKEKALGDVQAARAAAEKETESLKRKLADETDRAAKTSGELDLLRRNLDASRAEAQKTAQDVRRLGDDLKSAAEARQGLEASLEELRRELSEAKQDLAAARGEAESSKNALRASQEQALALGEDVKSGARRESELKNLLLAKVSELAVILKGRGAMAQAEEAYKIIIRFDPENGRAFLALGEIYYERGDFALSEDMFKKASIYLKKEQK